MLHQIGSIVIVCMEIFYLQQNLFAAISKKGDGAMIVTSLPLTHHLIILLSLNLCSIPPHPPPY